jgi:transcriptional regulator with XRE-family HTH domain
MVRKTVPVNRADKDFGTFGGRLWAERDRLGLKQADLCARLGVSKTTQIQYEQNKSRPSVDYLVELDGIGFDLMYLLTGIRGGDAMSAEHQNLIEAYDDASEPLKAAVFGVLMAPYSRDVASARAVPGWYRHELAGENDVRYQQATQPPRVLHDGPVKPLPGEFIQRPEADDAASGEG